MELLLETDPLVRREIPLLLDAAGLMPQANLLRDCKPVLTLETAIYVCSVLGDIQLSAEVLGACESDEWTGVIVDAVFWAQGAVWAAADGEIDLLGDCLRMLHQAMDHGYSLLTIH